MASTLYRPRGAVDLLSVPWIGRILKSRWGRLVLQIPFFVIAMAIMIDGFTGPQTASQNLATMLPWVQYRGVVVLAILLAGNLFCMGCPFTIPRTFARKIGTKGRRFPKMLRNKWLAITSLFAIFFLYEWLDLWNSPWLTAWVVLAYFVASFVLEMTFTESAFCKYVCPLGTFNFVYAQTSPTQIAVKNQATCQTCVGKECVNGTWSAQPVIRIDQIAVANGGTVAKEVIHSPQGVLGCGTELFPPQIKSNMDCIFCLDCVRACPHDNIGLMTRPAGRDLLSDSLPKRWDMSFLLIALTFMGLVNAFGMVPPVYDLLQQFANIGFTNEFLPLLVIFGVGSLVLPAVLMVSASWLSRLLVNSKLSLREIASGFAPAFVPLGFGIWIAHYGFHFLIAPLAFIPIVQEFLGFQGDWATYSTPLDAQVIGIVQVIALLGGFLWSMMIGQRSATRLFGARNGFIGLMPWALILLFVMVAAYQIFTLPMEMRGTDQLFAQFGDFIRMIL